MAKEFLAFPEENLKDVITVIRLGLEAAFSDGHAPMISDDTEEHLRRWCDEYQDYLEKENSV